MIPKTVRPVSSPRILGELVEGCLRTVFPFRASPPQTDDEESDSVEMFSLSKSG